MDWLHSHGQLIPNLADGLRVEDWRNFCDADDRFTDPEPIPRTNARTGETIYVTRPDAKSVWFDTERAGNRLELTEVECENLHGRVFLSTCYVHERLRHTVSSRAIAPSDKTGERIHSFLSAHGFHGFFMRQEWWPTI